MTWLDEQRGYDQARGDFTGVINNIQWANRMQAQHARSVIHQLEDHVQTVNAVNLDLQNRLLASEERVRFLDQANVDLCNELLALMDKAQEWTRYGETTQATIARQKAEIARLTDELYNARFNIEQLVDSPF